MPVKAKATPAKKAMVKAKPLRRPTSAYALFKKDMRQALRKLRKTDKLKLSTVLWRGVSIEDKQVYEARALKLQQRFAIRAMRAKKLKTPIYRPKLPGNAKKLYYLKYPDAGPAAWDVVCVQARTDFLVKAEVLKKECHQLMFKWLKVDKTRQIKL